MEKIFDTISLFKHRDRFDSEFKSNDFIFSRAAEQICSKLNEINRNFNKVIELEGRNNILFNKIKSSKLINKKNISEYYNLGMNGHVKTSIEQLPILNHSLDLIVSNLFLHWINDLPGTLIQIRKALKNDGLFIGTMFGSGTLKELDESFRIAEYKIKGKVTPRISPFVDIKDAGNLLQRAGFNLIVCDTDFLNIEYNDPLELLKDIRYMGESNCLVEREKIFLRKDILKTLLNTYKQKFSNDKGKIIASVNIIFVLGWSPHSSQQKPLKPGTANFSMEKILKM